MEENAECRFPAPKMGSHLTVQVNGCGPQGMQISEPFGLYKCCNRHDICYSLCNTPHSFCEKQFKKCMKGVCNSNAQDQQQECHRTAGTFSGMTAVMGQGFHAQGQKESCDCFGTEDEAKRRHVDFVSHFYASYNSSQASEENVNALLERFEGKVGELYYQLALRYGHSFVTFNNVRQEL